MTIQRVLITAGGTGGHLYPAQALAQQLIKLSRNIEILFVAPGLSTNRYFDRECFAFQEISSSPLFSRHLFKSLKGMVPLFKGLQQSLAILRQYQPDVVVGFGSYYTVPTLLAARWLKIPIILHEANSIPGKANQWLAPLATCIGLHFPSTAKFFKGKTVEVGLPLREGYQLVSIAKEQALAYYGLSSHLHTLLICGGSQGAQAINQLIKHGLSDLQHLPLQIIHLTGDAEMAEELTTLYQMFHIPAHVKAFENQMNKAWRAADAFIGRAGASTIAEALEFEVPGILIPYPYATDQHQEKNADFLVKTVGAAWKLLERELTPRKLVDSIESLYQAQHYLSFKEALSLYKQRSQQMTLSQLVLNIKSLALRSR